MYSRRGSEQTTIQQDLQLSKLNLKFRIMGNQPSSESTSSSSLSSTSSSSVQWDEKTTSLDLWKRADARFAVLKMYDDELRELYALDRTDSRRPDLADPLHDLIPLSNDKLIKLRKTMNLSRKTNIEEPSDDRIQIVGSTCKHVYIKNYDGLFEYRILSLLMNLPEHIRPYVCLAGGALVDMIIGHHPRNIADYDLFVTGADNPEKVLIDLMQHLNGLSGHEILSILRTRDAVTFYLHEVFEDKSLKIQVILRSYASPSEVVTGFDLDASAICWYKGQLYLTKRALYSLKTMTLYHDVDRMSTSYNYRLLKYSQRKGFSIRLPGPISTELKNNSFEHIKVNQGRFQPEYQNTLCFLYTASIMMGAGVYNLTISDYEDGSSGEPLTDMDADILSEADGTKSKTDGTKTETKTKTETETKTGTKTETKTKTGTKTVSQKDLERKRTHWNIMVDKAKELGIYMIRGKGSERTHKLKHRSLTLIGYCLSKVSKNPNYIERLLSFPIPEGYLGDFKRKFPRKLAFRTVNPGSQFTGSFNPVQMTLEQWATPVPIVTINTPKPYCNHQLVYEKLRESDSESNLPVLMELPYNHGLKLKDIFKKGAWNYVVVAIRSDQVTVSRLGYWRVLMRCPIVVGSEAWPYINISKEKKEEMKEDETSSIEEEKEEEMKEDEITSIEEEMKEDEISSIEE